MKQRLLLLFFAFVAATMLQASVLPYYGKHVLILVDQTPDVQNDPSLNQQYQNIVDLLTKGNVETLANGSVYPDRFSFDADNDQLTLYSFGVYGYTGMYGRGFTGDIRKIRDLVSQRSSIDVVNKAISEVLIHERANLRTSTLNLEQFLDNELRPLMGGEDPLAKEIKNSSGLTMSLFVQKAILDFIDTSKPAEKYYIVIVTNYQGGVNSDAKDRDYLKTLVCQDDKYQQGYIKYLADMYSPYASTYEDFIFEQYSPTGVKVRWMNLCTRGEVGCKPTIKKGAVLSQKAVHDNKFTFSGAEILFAHPQSIHIQKVELRLTTTDSTYVYDITSKMHPDEEKYKWDDFDIKLKTIPAADGHYNYTYVFYTISEISGKQLVPQVFTANQDVVLKLIPIIEGGFDYIFWGGVLLIIGILALLIWLYISRGKTRKVNLKFDFVPVSNERFMDVCDMKVKEYDCWYMTTDVTNRTQTLIKVRGKMDIEQKHFAQSVYNYRLECKVADVDFDDNFTFRPKGDDQHGVARTLGKWYKVNVNREDGTFMVDIIAYLDTEKHPELRHLDDVFWQEDHILQTQIDFRVLAVNKDDNAHYEAINLEDGINLKDVLPSHPQKVYEFIARPNFALRDSWIAFDPGTSGACAAFTTGGNIGNADNIHVVYEPVTYSGEDVFESVFPSKIHITDYASIFRELPNGAEIENVSSWEEGEDLKAHKDFIFGWAADQLVATNTFQSVKKLLGYTNSQSIFSDNIELKIDGKKLAQLLVKGLYIHTKRYIMNQYLNPNRYQKCISPTIDPRDIENHYLENGEFNPKKAIVAVPNNYTMPKIQDMVDTVKALNQFREVHYIYESEGVLMHFFHKSWRDLQKMKDKKFIIFDMGGATINATAFRISKMKVDAYNNVTDVEVETIGKIGYCVGGDDIDYAIIRQLYKLKAVSDIFQSEDAIKTNMASHKQLLIKMARELKLEIIALAQNKLERVIILQGKESFTNYLQSYAKALGWLEEMEITQKEADLWTKVNNICNSKILQHYVYSKVLDATKELYASMNQKYVTSSTELIFSGRSTLFPKVCDTVKDVVGKNYHIWEGLMTNGYLDANLVKTAVAQGACWYANFNQHIRIKHDIVTTAFGYVDYRNGEEVFVPIIKPGDKFRRGEIESKPQRPLSPNLLEQVDFIQMQGSNYEQILKDFRNSKGENKHKLNILDKVKPGSNIDTIKIKLDERSNFFYWIAAGEVDNITPENYVLSRLRTGTTVRTEISEENNDSYLFAAISSAAEIKQEQEVIKEAPKSIKNKSNRF